MRSKVIIKPCSVIPGFYFLGVLYYHQFPVSGLSAVRQDGSLDFCSSRASLISSHTKMFARTLKGASLASAAANAVGEC